VHSDIQAREVVWYRQYGKHPERIIRDGHGREYVIGDHSWNTSHADKLEYFEHRFEMEAKRRGEWIATG
jgi:hypothetical protein